MMRKGESRRLPERLRGVRKIDLSTASLATSDLAREINRDIVLEFIRFHQPISRVNLARLSGLQPSTISAIVDSLVREGWVKEGEIVRGSRGRPSTMISISDDLAIIAIDLRPDRAIVAMIDLPGRLLVQETVPIDARPEAAVSAYDGSKGTVWTVEDGRMRRRVVSFGHRTEDARLEIKAGLPSDALVVTETDASFQEGRAARVVREGRQ